MNKKLLVIGISILIFLIITIGIISAVVVVKNKENGNEIVELETNIPDMYIRVDEEITLTVHNCPDDADVIWDLGDGRNATGKTINISYPDSDGYNITVEAKADSFLGYGNGILWVFNHDVEGSRSGTFSMNVRPATGEGFGTGCIIPVSIVGPLLDVNVQIQNAVGEFEIAVVLEEWGEPEGFYLDLDRQTFTARRNGITYDETFEGLPTPPEGHEYSLTIWIFIDQAISGEWTIEFSLMY